PSTRPEAIVTPLANRRTSRSVPLRRNSRDRKAGVECFVSSAPTAHPLPLRGIPRLRKHPSDDLEVIMRKTTISLALLAAFALGGGSPLFAQSTDSTSNANGPSADPPAGARMPASPDSPQSSG